MCVKLSARKGGDRAASGDLRLGHAWRRASIPLHALTTLLSALGAFSLWEFRVFSTNLNILRSICSGHGDPVRRAAATVAPDGSPRSYPRPTPTAASGREDEASACSELRLGCHPETPVIEPCRKFLQHLRCLCQFMYLTTVKLVLRNSFDLKYLRKMCGTWVLSNIASRGSNASKKRDRQRLVRTRRFL